MRSVEDRVEKRGNMSDNKITIIFVINGHDQPEVENVHEPLAVARKKALKDSDNTSRPAEEWGVYTEDGKELTNVDAKIETFQFPNPVRLTLTLKVGAGG